MSDANATRTEIEFDPAARQTRSQAFLFLALEADRPLAGGARYVLDDLDEVAVGRSDGGAERNARRVPGKRRLEVRAPSTFLSKEHALFRSADDGWTVEDLGSRNGVAINGAPIQQATRLNPGDIIALGRLFFVFQVEEAGDVGDLDASDVGADTMGMLTLLPGLQQRLARLRQEAARSTAITLVGETGTGKEVMAKAIHDISGRRGPYLGLNCGAIPRDLIQSELFGFVKGAFSGAADNRNGYLREAHQGTLLLDEIVASPEQVQVALLRVIQERAVTPLGGRQPQPIDVRIIAAAQKPLEEAVEEGKFRDDLRARLEAFRFELPPLRERMEDLGIFAAATLRAMGVSAEQKPRISSLAAMRLLRYDWPRNIRELTQAIDVAWGGAKDGEIGDADLPKPKEGEGVPTARLKQQLIAHMKATKGNVAEVGRRMNRPRSTIHFFLERFGLDAKSFRDD